MVYKIFTSTKQIKIMLRFFVQVKVEALFSSPNNVIGEDGRRNSAGFVFSRDLQHDDEVLSMEPIIKPKPKIICLDEKTVMAISKANIYSQIVVSSFFHLLCYTVKIRFCLSPPLSQSLSSAQN